MIVKIPLWPWSHRTGKDPSVDSPGTDDTKKDTKPGSRKPSAAVPVRSWFVTFMCMNIPIIGWIYLIILACSPSAGAKKDFAKAYLIYKTVFLLITLAILAVFAHYGLILLDQVLAYMEML